SINIEKQLIAFRGRGGLINVPFERIIRIAKTRQDLHDHVRVVARDPIPGHVSGCETKTFRRDVDAFERDPPEPRIKNVIVYALLSYRKKAVPNIYCCCRSFQ